jgi:hypothetical protein
MTKEELQDRISYLERTLQRKAEQVASDERAITKSEEEVNKQELAVAKAKTPLQLKSAQTRLNSKKKERQRKMIKRDAHNREHNNLRKQLLNAKQQLSEFTEDPIPTQSMPVNPMEKIYQVFVSSTYEDLKEERQEVMAAVVSTGNVPIGMEYFPAGDSAPFDYIKKQIDEADYYILVVAGKYGSINNETGISYTEMEFDYAIEKKVPVAVLIFRDLNKLTADKIELDNDRRELLEAFRKRVRDGRMANFWEDKKDLRSEVKDAINSMIVESPRTGWIRADRAISINQETIDDNLLEKTIPLNYSEFGIFGMSSVDIALLPKSITIAELLKIVVPSLRIPKVESAIDEVLKRKYEYLKDESIESAKLTLLKYKLVETNNLVIQNEGVYTVWSVTPKAIELWASIEDF